MSNEYNRPPFIAEWIIRQVYSGRSSDTRLGDLGEIYNIVRREKGRFAALLWYWQQTIISSVLRVLDATHWSFVMLKSYMITAFRNIIKYKGFSTVNVLGLALAMSLCLFVIKFILFFYSMDNFHKDHDNLYIVTMDVTTPSGNKLLYVNTPYPMSLAANEQCSEIEQFANLTSMSSRYATFEDVTIETYNVYADQGFINMMSIEVLEGNRGTFLTEPNSVILTKETAEKIFGYESPLGKIMDFGDVKNVRVTGVISRLPHNSKFHDFNAILSYPTAVLHRSAEDNANWIRLNNFMIVRPAEKHNIDGTVALLNQIKNNNIHRENYTYTMSTMPLTDFVWYPDARGYSFGIEFPPYMIVTLAICILSILFIACLNYVNLNTAKSLTRLKEIGLRKVIGARRKEILSQFLAESVVVTMLAFLISIYLHKIVIKLFLSIHPDIPQFFYFPDLPATYLVFFIFALLTGIFSGLFPAFFLAKLQPVDIITRFSRSPLFSRKRIKKILIGIQLSLSFFFVIVTITTYSELRYARNFDIGLTPDDIINVRITPDQYLPFKNAISSSNFATEISASGYPPGAGKSSPYLQAIRTGVTDSIRLYYLAVDENMMSMIDLEMITGIEISREAGSLNGNNVILNETAVKRFGFTDPLDALGKPITLKDSDCTITGVVKDFTHGSYYEGIQPLALRYKPDSFRYLNIRVPGDKMQEALKHFEGKWKETFYGVLFDYRIYEVMVEEEGLMAEFMMKVGSFMAFVAIIIACMGLLGITMYEIEVKTKEIGIRKVLGAATSDIILLFSREFLILNTVAIVITVPLCLFLNDLATGHVANTAGLGFVQFASGILFMGVIGLLSILSQLIKAGNIKPTETLRFE